MTIDEAIKILECAVKGTWPTPNTNFDIAVKLGIEALKNLKMSRKVVIS